jgi:prepilin-type N-terminal cleavage/methylation domain-containing protein
MKKGYTLIELLVVITITGVLMAIGLSGWTTYRNRRTLDEIGLTLVSSLRQVRSKAVRGEKPTSIMCTCSSLDGYSVEEDSGNLEVAPVCNGSQLIDPSCQDIIVINDQANWELSTSLMFKSLTGYTDESGPFYVNLTYHDIGGTVSISNYGAEIKWERTN